MKSLFSLSLALVVIISSCTQKNKTDDSSPTSSDEVVLGKLEHGFTLNPLTQEKFDEGLLLLHNFEYDDALVKFEEATSLDSTEVLTHWGEAMCHYKALWKLQNTSNGREILSRLGDTKEERLASISDPIEKAMWEIVEIMYGNGEFKERNISIKSHLAGLHSKYPKHQEIGAFYVLSLIWATEEYGNGSEDLQLAASIADKIIEMNPLHPGALHYKIHALDGPTSASNAVDAADAYAKVASDAAHALHMPSHIYLAMGNWDGVVNSNRASYDASVNRMVEKELKDGARGYHSFAWLHYGLLQQGRYTKAEELLNEMLSHVPNDPTKGARGYLLGMQSRQLVESKNASNKTAFDFDINVDDIGIVSKSVKSFLRSQIAFENKDAEAINDEIKWLNSKIYVDSLQITDTGIALCAAGNSRYAPTENSIRMAKVIKHQIEGMKALLTGNQNMFETKMKASIELEEQTNFPAGPPNITQPSFEQYGEWLLANGRYAEANVQFDKCLARMPRRAKSLIGKMTALKALNKNEEMHDIRDELKTMLSKADSEIKELLEV